MPKFSTFIVDRRLQDSASLKTVIQTLSDVSGLTMEVQLKVLQAFLPLMTSYKSLHDDLVAQSLQICFGLFNQKDALVSNTAAATLRQLVIFLFDKVVAEDASEGAVTSDLGKVKLVPSSLESLRPCARDACTVLQDLCALAAGNETSFLGVQHISKQFALELLESVLSNNRTSFERHIEFSHLLSKFLCPLVIKSFSEKNEFSQTVRLVRIASILVQHFSSLLVMECEVFFTIFLKNMDSDSWWTRVLVLEVLSGLCAQPTVLSSIFQSYDLQSQATNIFEDLVASLSRHLSSLNISSNTFSTSMRMQW
jgi:hypothetical protein